MKPARLRTATESSRRRPAADHGAHRRPAVLIGTLILVGLSLRGPLIAVAPVTGQVRSGLHIDAATAGLFTSIPVLLFSLAAPPALLLLVKVGMDRTLLLALLAIAAGAVLRSGGGLPVALAGTIVLGIAIGIGNVTVPVTIGRDFPTRAGPMTGLYTVALNGGAMLASLLTAPLAAVIGWRWALASWAVSGLVAASAWTWVSRSRRIAVRSADTTAATGADASGGDAPAADATGADATGADASRADTTGADAIATDDAPAEADRRTPVWRRPAALLLALAFGCQSFGYYGITAWLPSLLADEQGLSRSTAGVSSALFQVMGMAGAVVVPIVIRSGVGQRAVMLSVCLSWVVLPVGLVVAPALWWLWCGFGGLAQGGGFTIIFTIVLKQARGTTDRQRLSTVVQGLGYAIGASGPTVVGAVHQATGSWNAPMLVVAFGLAVMAVAGTTATALTPRSAAV